MIIPTESQALLAALPERLLPWFAKHARALPWRADRAPYHVWLSEIMLQQTRVEAVIGYYDRFLCALPTVEALANASLDEACRLLRDTDMDIGRIAALSGYTSASYFVQAFKVDKKMAPGAWRKAFRHPPRD